MSPDSFAVFAGLLHRESGLLLGPDKTYLLETRLAGILREQALGDLDALAARLRGGGSSAVARQVVDAMTTNESFFFRDDKPFTHFRAQALPALLARGQGPLRVWSAAASSGQEAYSLAMILAECAGQVGSRGVEIVGTDISPTQIARAREGRYTQFEVQRGLPMQFLVRYFRKDGATWLVQDAIRARVQFREWNLLADLRPLGQFDAVFCRNVLIYFDQPTKARVLAAIARQLAPDGVLYLGGAETVLGISDRFDTVPGERGVYRLTRQSVPA